LFIVNKNGNITGSVLINVTLRRLSVYKEITITYSECVFVALVIRHPKRMRRIVICYGEIREQCTYNVTLRRVRVTTVAVEKQ
jgi:hypothetical protein